MPPAKASTTNSWTGRGEINPRLPPIHNHFARGTPLTSSSTKSCKTGNCKNIGRVSKTVTSRRATTKFPQIRIQGACQNRDTGFCHPTMPKVESNVSQPRDLFLTRTIRGRGMLPLLRDAIAPHGRTRDWAQRLLRPLTLAIAWPAVGALLAGVGAGGRRRGFRVSVDR